MIHRVLDIRDLSSTAYVLRFSREGLDFAPGQYVTVGRAGSLAVREYTVYSSPRDGDLEVLIRRVDGGLVSPLLRRLEPGDALDVEGPFGSFRLPEEGHGGYLFVASGTGIAPFHCFARTHPGLDYLLLHGARSVRELYERETFDPARFVSCIRREDGGNFRGRVTDCLREHPEFCRGLCYLCGNSDMIYDVMAILRDRGVARSHIFAEIYF